MPWQKLAEAAGLARGGAVRSVLDAVRGVFGLDSVADSPAQARGVAFSSSVIALCAKMAKADGVVVQIEADTFERLFHIPLNQRGNVRRLFDMAKQDVAGFDSYASQIARKLRSDPALLSDILECLFHIAVADGILHPAEDRFLRVVAERFGLSNAGYQHMRALFVSDAGSPFAVLGLAPDAPDEEVKSRHRQLVLEHHPDRLIGRGVPAEFVVLAERKLARINAAYDAIRKERAL